MEIVYNFAIELCAPFFVLTIVMCAADWLCVMFRRAFN